MKLALGTLPVGAGLAFAGEYADVVTQAVLTGIQHLVELVVAMMIAPGQAGAASALVLGGLVAALSVGSALAVGFVVMFVWRIRRRRSDYG
jgi:predicted MFS family arabinose efflux permease